MTKILMGLLILGALVVTYPTGKFISDTIRSGKITKIETNKDVEEVKLDKSQNLLDSFSFFSAESKVVTVKNILTLEAKNTVVLRGPVTGESVGKLIKEIATMSRNLPKSDKIYLVLDTPGGSVFDGMDFIDFLEGVPQEIKTVTLFAASMGFQIAENNPGERLIARNGTLMSHRASGGVNGQFDGELETRYKMIKRKIDYLDLVASKRVGLEFNAYKEKIVKEWWIHGFDAVDEKVADKMVLVQCGESINGTEEMSFKTFFGPIKVTFDKCPLVREPVSVDMSGVTPASKTYLQSVFNDLFFNKSKFTKDIVVTNQFYKIFP